MIRDESTATVCVLTLKVSEHSHTLGYTKHSVDYIKTTNYKVLGHSKHLIGRIGQ